MDASGSGDAGKITQDQGFKALILQFPRDAIAFLLPEAISRHGQPVDIVPVQQQNLPRHLGDPNFFVDVALRLTWADGTQMVIMLVEHYSEAPRPRYSRSSWSPTATAARSPGIGR